MSFTEGSLWRLWDLHVHTPASYYWQGKKFNPDKPEDDEELLEKLIKTINESPVSVFGFMDYWTFEGYLKVRNYLSSKPENYCTKKILPGIELRLEAPTDYKLNTHLILNDTFSETEIAELKSTLKIVVDNNERSLSDEVLAEVAKSYDAAKLALHSFKPEDKDDFEKMLKLGKMTAKITRPSFKEAKRRFEDKGVLIIQPFDTSDGAEKLDWKEHPFDDSELMKLSDVFETRKQSNVDLFHGKIINDDPGLTEIFIHNLGGKPKPVVSGSDAHKFGNYGNYPSGRCTWIKADPTFKGLLQTLYEPAARTYIGEEPNKIKHVRNNPTKFISKIKICKNSSSTLSEDWFNSELVLNPGLVAIIGNKGSGKSALADIIALLGNSHVQEREFLNKERFCHPRDNKASHYTATMHWQNEDDVINELSLDSSPDLTNPERVRYLPQKHIENLCSEIGQGSIDKFENELKKVIFSHVDEQDKLGLEDLDNLLNYLTQRTEESISGKRNEVERINDGISMLELDLEDKAVEELNNQYCLKRKEYIAHIGLTPKPFEALTNDDPAIVQLQKNIEDIEKKLLKITAQIAVLNENKKNNNETKSILDRIKGALSNFKQDFGRLENNINKDIEKVGLNLKELISLEIKYEKIDEKITNIEKENEEIIERLLGKEDKKGLEEQKNELIEEKTKLVSKLDEPSRLYEKYKIEVKEWTEKLKEIVGSRNAPDSMRYLFGKIYYIKNYANIKLEELKEERLIAVKSILEEYALLKDEYKKYYSPVQSFAENHEFISENIKLEFNVVSEVHSFKDNFMQMINHSIAGSFYGIDEASEKIKELMKSYDFDDVDSIMEFYEDIDNQLHCDVRNGQNTKVSLSKQVSSNETIYSLYNYLYSLEWLKPTYTLTLDGREISELSPGERDALLLVFYLLLDQENIPLILDQPEPNLDNESIYLILVKCIKEAKERRQVIMVTHNPNLAIVCDAEQIIAAEHETNKHTISYKSGAIENPELNLKAVNVLEGTWPAFDSRKNKYFPVIK